MTQLTHPAAASGRALIAELVRDVVAGILPGVPRAEVTEDRHLKHLGADSVDRVEIILMLIDRLELDEPMSSFSQLPDIGALIDFLAAHPDAKGRR